ncbi:MAG: hypothetical protein CMF59_17340 [Leptospiraceae bacterium]|nr:hypothetical protein [Leptospiraceae bacterium]
MPGSLFDYSIAGFGGMFCIVWALGLLIPGKGRALLTAVAFVSISGIRLLWEAFFLSGLYRSAPFTYLLLLPLMYLIGPLIMAYYDRLSGRPWRGADFLHLSFPLLAAIPLLWLTDRELLPELIEQVYVKQRTPEGWLMVIWILGPKILILLYSLWIPLRRSAEGAKALHSLSSDLKPFAQVLLTYVWLMILADIAGYIWSIPVLFRGSVWSHSLAAILVYWFSRHQPSAMLEISEAIQRVRYARTKLSGLNVEDVLTRLNELMARESYYADEDLRLPGLAEALDVSPHQLSELINSHLQISFTEFVNRHRVFAACELLEEDSSRSILSIALSVGFNSKSSFNRAFRQITGTTPGEFRENPASVSRPTTGLGNFGSG